MTLPVEKNALFMTVSWMGDTTPCHHTCALQQWRHHLTACVKSNGKHGSLYNVSKKVGHVHNNSVNKW